MGSKALLYDTEDRFLTQRIFSSVQKTGVSVNSIQP